MTLTQFVLVVVLLQDALCNPVSYYKNLTAEEVKHLASWTLRDKEPMWQISGQFEGDIILEPGQRNGIINTRKRWPNREIPYEFSNEFTDAQKKYIDESLKNEFSKTCITVRSRKSTDPDYVYITGNNTGCWSRVGRSGGRQRLNLQRNGCIWRSTIVHEFLHAAGFYHQQSASERDDYVEIFKENIKKGKEGNFRKYPDTVVTSFVEKYDYASIMHYNKYAFSANGLPTILPKDPTAQIGQRKGLSKIDIAKLNKMYDCV